MRIRLLFSVFALVCALFCSRTSRAVNATNAVGYVNLSLVPGFNLIHTPLFYQPNLYLSNFVSLLNGVEPDGLSVFFLGPEGYRSAVYDAEAGAFEPILRGGEVLYPGRGYFVFNPTPGNITITFPGEILQGRQTNAIPSGFSLVGSKFPKEGSLEELSFPTEPGDVVFLWEEATQSYHASVFDDISGHWLPPMREIQVGEAFVVFKNEPAEWIAEFSVIEP